MGLSHLTKHTSVTYTYEVDWSTNQGHDPEVIDQLLDLEDDIVTNAIFVYNVDASFGDEYANTFVVYYYDMDKVTKRPATVYTPPEDRVREYGMEPVKDWGSGKGHIEKALAEVDFNVRGATVRL